MRHDPAGSFDEAVAIYAALRVLEPVPSTHGYVSQAIQHLCYALKARGYTLSAARELIPWEELEEAST